MKITSTVTYNTNEVFVRIERDNYKLLLFVLRSKNIQFASNLTLENMRNQFTYKQNGDCIGVARISLDDNRADWYSSSVTDHKTISLNDLVDFLNGEVPKPARITIETENSRETEAVKNFVVNYSGE